ncbi:histidine kinase N-terminal 7TM domain-containing protein, partial [Chloroflexota bacterium]
MINPLSNPSYLLPPIIVGAVFFAMLVLVWRQGERKFSSRLFSYLLICFGVSAFLTFFMRTSPDPEHALPWDKALIISILPSFALFFHFIYVYTNRKRIWWLFPSIYFIIIALVVVTATTGLVIQGMTEASYGYAPVVGPLIFLAFAPTTLFILTGAVFIMLAYWKSNLYEEKNRLLYFAIAMVFPLIGGILDSFTDLPPASIWSHLVFSVICGIAILRYHLLDVRLVVKKGLIYLIISLSIGIPYLAALFFISEIFKTTKEPWWMHVIAILVFAAILRPLYTAAQNWVDRLFYRDRYDYLKALKQFTHEAQSIVNLEQIGVNTVRLLGGALRATSACLLLPRGENSDWVVVSCTISTPPSTEAILRYDSPVIRWLQEQKTVLLSQYLDVTPQLQSLSLAEKSKINKIGAKVFVPVLNRENNLSAILTLGEKLSRQDYSGEDLELLKTLTNQLAIALDNARLYDETIRARDNLEALLNSMNDCVIILNHDRTIQFMNSAANNRFGHSTGKNCWSTLGKEVCCDGCPVDSLLGNSGIAPGFIISAGERYYDISATRLINPDGSASIIEVLRDITERQRNEVEKKELEQKAQLASRLASIGMMASGIAHEINNPLTAIIGFSQLLIQKDLPQEIMEDLTIINKDAQRVA